MTPVNMVIQFFIGFRELSIKEKPRESVAN